jgi:hypothetical protein
LFYNLFWRDKALGMIKIDFEISEDKHKINWAKKKNMRRMGNLNR